MVAPLPVAGHTYGHIREYSAAEVATLLTASGFKDATVSIQQRPRTNPAGSRAAKLAFAAELFFGESLPTLRGFLVASGVKE
jgi:hypothetical protein